MSGHHPWPPGADNDLQSAYRLIGYARFNLAKNNLSAVETLLDKADKAILRAAARAEGCESAGDPGDGGDTTTPRERYTDPAEWGEHRAALDNDKS